MEGSVAKSAARPRPIVFFELLRFAAIALGVLQTAVLWQASASRPLSALLVPTLTYVFVIALTLLVSRVRSLIAMWISIALFVLGLPQFFLTYVVGNLSGFGLVALVHVVANVVAYALLFTPSARAWMSKKPLPTKSDDLGVTAN